MAIDTDLNSLIINELTKAKYDELAAAGLINENELYIVTDAETAVKTKEGGALVGDGTSANPLDISEEFKTQLSNNAAVLAQEILDRQAADSQLQDNIASEAETRSQADAGLQEEITRVEGVVTEETGKLQQSITSEANTRKSEIIRVEGLISTEAQTRRAEDVSMTELINSKQDVLTPGINISIVDNVISSTAQESFFRGRYANWDTVPTNGLSYPNDIYGNHIPSNTDYIIIEDSSTVPGGQVEVQMTMETDRYSSYPTQKLETVVNGITYNGVGVFDDGNIEVFCNTDAGNYTAHWKTLKNSVEYQGKTYEAGSVFFKVVIKPENNTTQNAKLSLGNPYTGSWRFSYRGNWDLDNKNGWKAEYQIEDVLPVATETQAGINKLYTAGTNMAIVGNEINTTATEIIRRRW